MNVTVDNNTFVLLIFCGLGVFGFFWGFSRLRKKRLIEDIPTSTVRGMAMGMVELVGKVKKQPTLKSPFKGADCVFYRYTVEEYRRSGKSGRWVTIAKGDSTECTFLIDDGTGIVLVSPKGAEYILPVDYEFRTGFGRDIPANLIAFMNMRGLSHKSFFGSKSLRFKEWHICPEEMVYILGHAQKAHSFVNDRKVALMARLEEIKKDPKRMEEIDIDKNGEISAEEWDMARKKIEQELIEEEIKAAQADDVHDIVVARSERDKIFIISDHSQKDLIKKLFWQSILGIYGGAPLAIIMLVFFLQQIGILKF